MIEVRATTVDDLAAAGATLMAENWRETGVRGESLSLALNLYRNVEQQHLLHLLGAFEDERLVGYAALWHILSPHTGEPRLMQDVLFVARAARATGAGQALIKACREKARELGCALLWSAVPGSNLDRILALEGIPVHQHVYLEQPHGTR